MFSRILLITLMIAPVAQANSKRAIIDLVQDGHYYSVIPWMKDYLVKNKRLDAEMDRTLDRLITATGVKPFESLPDKILQKSSSGNVRYILGKRQLKKGNTRQALSLLKQVEVDHPSYAFVANLKGTVASAHGDHAEAVNSFRDCIRYSERLMGKASSQAQKDQLETNRDYCLAGIARAQFATGDYRKAELSYLDIPKDSFVWPEILFEEAWNSYYLKNYNRTLGKLVSYRAPVFDFIFKPEVEVIKALTYLRMCLYEDSRKTTDDFYAQFYNPSKELRRFIMSHGKNYKYYYGLMADFESGKRAPSEIVESVLKSIRKDAAFLEMKASLSSAINEYNNLKKTASSGTQRSLLRNLQTVLDEYRSIIGAYVRSGMVSKYGELYSAFQGMSYIKLEVLAQRKERLYQSDVVPGKKRGDVKYIERNDKQYFWTFNGEFWADELGDYVFALRSEC